jgi:hypothetical protein
MMNLQQVASQLSDELSRSVVVVGLDDRELAASAPTAVGELNRLAVPIRGGAGTIAAFWLESEERRPLSSTDYALIDAAAGIASDLLSDGRDARPGSSRDATMSRLLDDDLVVRRGAFLDAVARRWVDRGKRTVVHAVMLDDSVGTLQRVAFGRHVAAATPSHTAFVREHESIVYLVSRETGAPLDLDARIRAESSRLDVAVISVGSAHHDPSTDDLGDTAKQARVAAELTAALPELQPAKDIADLGGWVLLHALPAGSKRIADISPAAEHLCRAGDRVQRETIETYLDAGGQARAACERLHIHRTTLYYRLDNMPPVVKEALDDGMKRSTLHLTLKLIRLWEQTGVF